MYVCIHFAEFAAQSLLRLRPDLTQMQVAVLEGEAPLEQVSSMNMAARKAGVRRGMSRAEMEAFPQVILLRRSPAVERSAREAILQTARDFTPRVEILARSETALDLALDMTGTSLLFGDAETCASTLTKAMRQLRFAEQIAVSGNLLTAACLAPFVTREPAVVPHGREAESLQTLPLSALLLTEKQQETFSMWGLASVADLAALPEVDLIARMGQEGKRLRQMARGECSHLLVPIEEDFVLEELVEFESAIENLESLLFVLGPALDQLILRAQNRALALASVTLTLRLDGMPKHVRVLKTALPVTDRALLLKLIHLDLQAHPPSAGVLGLAVLADAGSPSEVQLGLFAPSLPEPSRLQITLARVDALVGEGRSGRPRLQDAHGSDRFSVEPFRLEKDAPPKKERHAASFALRRLRPPTVIRMQMRDAKPYAFTYESILHTVQYAYGPWHSSGQWWTQQAWSTEEWDICAAHQGGDIFGVLTHDLLSDRWMLTSLYD